MPNKTIFKNTDRVRTTVPPNKPPSYKFSRTVITGEPVNKANFKPKPVIKKPTIGERAKKGVQGAKKVAGSVAKGVRKGVKGALTSPSGVGQAARFPNVARMEKAFSKGGKVTK
jgi:hypothetical protein